MTAGYMTVGAAAVALGISDKTVVRMFDAGALWGYTLTSGHRRIAAAAVDAILSGVPSE